MFKFKAHIHNKFYNFAGIFGWFWGDFRIAFGLKKFNPALDIQYLSPRHSLYISNKTWCWSFHSCLLETLLKGIHSFWKWSPRLEDTKHCRVWKGIGNRKFSAFISNVKCLRRKEIREGILKGINHKKKIHFIYIRVLGS